MNQDGISPLHLAVINNSIEIAIFLLSYKANPNVGHSGKDGKITKNCILHSAVGNNSLTMVELLLDAGAEPTLANVQQQTTLHVAAATAVRNPLDTQTRLKIVDLLIKKKVNPNATDNDGYTVLHIAIFNNAVDVIERLLDEPNIKVNLREKKIGITPLHLAAYFKSDKISSMLIANKAEVDATDNNGETPLVYAASSNALYVTDQLLKAKANTNRKNKKRNSRIPLHVAAACGSHEVGILLINADKSTIQAVDDLGFTPLHYAELFNRSEFSKLLLQIQANQMGRSVESLPPPQKSERLSPTDLNVVGQLATNTLINDPGKLIHQLPEPRQQVILSEIVSEIVSTVPFQIQMQQHFLMV